MLESDDKKISTGMSPKRLESLSDGIFAFAMTLLVLSINLPEGNKNIDVGNYIANQLPNFWNFALSFLLLAIIWLYLNQQFHHFAKTSFGSIMINIFLLLFVALLPFSTSLLSDFPDSRASELFFNSNMFLIASLLAVNWLYAKKSDLIEISGNGGHIAEVNKRLYIFPIVSALAIVACYIIPGYSTMLYLLIPIYVFLVKKR